MDLAALKLICDAFNRRFDELEARLDRRFSPPPTTEPRDAVEEIRVGATTSEPSVASAPVCSTTTVSIDEHSPDPAAARAKSDTSGVFPDANPIHLDRANVTLLVASGALAEQDTAVHFATEFTFPTPVAQQVAEHFGSLVARAEQEKRVVVVRVEGVGASGRVCIGVHLGPRGLLLRHSVHTEHPLGANSAAEGQSELHATAIFYSLTAPDDPGLLRCVRLDPVKRVLRTTPLSDYDGSLDDDPPSSVTNFDALLDRAVGRDGQAPAAAATLCSDAVGAAGGGLLAWEMAAGSAQSTCLKIFLAGDSSFAEVFLVPVTELSITAVSVPLAYTVATHCEAAATYIVLVLVEAIVVFANGGELGFHLSIINDASAVSADAFARILKDILARHREASSPLLLRGHVPVHAYGAASVLDDPAATAPHNWFALQASQHAVEFVTDSIELAYFHAEVLLDTDSEHSTMGPFLCYEPALCGGNLVPAPVEILRRDDKAATVLLLRLSDLKAFVCPDVVFTTGGEASFNDVAVAVPADASAHLVRLFASVPSDLSMAAFASSISDRSISVKTAAYGFDVLPLESVYWWRAVVSSRLAMEQLLVICTKPMLRDSTRFHKLVERGRALTTVLPGILLSAEQKMHSMVLCIAAAAVFDQDVLVSVHTAEHFASCSTTTNSSPSTTAARSFPSATLAAVFTTKGVSSACADQYHGLRASRFSSGGEC